MTKCTSFQQNLLKLRRLKGEGRNSIVKQKLFFFKETKRSFSVFLLRSLDDVLNLPRFHKFEDFSFHKSFETCHVWCFVSQYRQTVISNKTFIVTEQKQNK